MNSIKHAYLAGGCFWCTEAIYRRLQGVIEVFPGYSGGVVKNPSYREVCTGKTGHAETIKITYNPKEISFNQLLEVFFGTHDPTTINRQGNDIGSHYRSIAFFSDKEEKKNIEDIIGSLNDKKIYNSKIVTEITKFENFYRAEDYHENYYDLNKNQPYCDLVITPKIQKFKSKFKSKSI
tara:strand:- start:15053 stop:15589 length:537 start_codon:yes stop_codon:yes gene_type:complete